MDGHALRQLVYDSDYRWFAEFEACSWSGRLAVEARGRGRQEGIVSE
ncbi:MAG: hypothetical protein OEO18_20495 [Gammaproteobacteria bacterium]|nr:hypothetical protein [Gammaproteobacteria bacterium]